MSNDKKFDVFGIGNAIVDIIAQVDDDTMATLGLNKGSMALMDTDSQADILTKIQDHSLSFASGGSAANTMVALAQSGGTGVYTGKVAHDTNGTFYKKGMEEEGIAFDVTPADKSEEPTGSCVVLTTPDAERTMCTHLGVSTSLSKSDINLEHLAQSKICYVEGYLWDAESPRAACHETFSLAKQHGVRTAFTFSDSFLVDRFGDDFKTVVNQYCDILFCNADEAKKFLSLDDVDQCATELGKLCDLAFITDGPHGSYVVEAGTAHKVPGFDVTAIDTNGAGDAFAGGVLYGLTHGMTAAMAAKWGNYFASQVVAKSGPRLASAIGDQVAKVVG